MLKRAYIKGVNRGLSRIMWKEGANVRGDSEESGTSRGTELKVPSVESRIRIARPPPLRSWGLYRRIEVPY